MSISDSEIRARAFLDKRIKLKHIQISKGIKDECYMPSQLENCDLFRIESYDFQIGSTEYIAVPHDGGEPFCFEIGE